MLNNESFLLLWLWVLAATMVILLVIIDKRLQHIDHALSILAGLP